MCLFKKFFLYFIIKINYFYYIMFQEEEISTSYQSSNNQKNDYQKLKDGTIQRLEILGDKIEKCVNLVEKETGEEVLLLLHTIQIIYKELLLLKDDVETLKSHSQ
jgi:hypothetical protein